MDGAAAVEMSLPFRTAGPLAQQALHQAVSDPLPHAFDRLPAELLFLILAQTDSPKDLGAFVTTCQRSYRVFQAHKTQILEAVIRNAFPDTQLCEAVGACKTWPLKAAYDHGQWVLLLPAQQWFLRQYWLSPRIGSITLKDPGLLLAMCRLWWLLDRFIRSFFDDAIKNIATEVDDHDLRLGWNAPLDVNERLRIQRALLRFELYRQLFPPIDGPQWAANDWPYRSTHQYTPSLFLRQLSHWERGELLAVSQYLYRIVRAMHLNIRQNLLKIVPLYDPPPGKDKMRYLLPTEGPFAAKVDLYQQLFIFPTNHSQFERHYSCVARLGLPFISWLQSLPLADQAHIFGLHWAEETPKTMEREISYITKSDMCLDKWASAMGSQSMAGPSTGWHELFRDRVREEGISVAMACSKTPLHPRRTLQEMGYLFWSEARFRNISFPSLKVSDEDSLDQVHLLCDFDESAELTNSLQAFAAHSEMYPELWRTLQHSDQVEMLTDCFTRSYPPRKIIGCVPIYYGVIMDEAESAQVARQFMHERRELVNELVSRLSDIWLELVTTGPP